MKQYRFLSIGLALTSLLTSASLHAQPRPSTSGEIVLEDTSQNRSTFRVVQDQAIAFARSLDTEFGRLATGQSMEQITLPTESVLLHLTAVYLYCSVQQGVCPQLLDAILEIDVANSRLQGRASCPTMKQFWRLWVRNDMEERHKYQVKTGFLNETAEFRQKIRPRYIQCEATVAEAIKGDGSNSAFFAKRLSGERRQLATHLTRYLELVKAEVPNVFVATGARRPDE